MKRKNAAAAKTTHGKEKGLWKYCTNRYKDYNKVMCGGDPPRGFPRPPWMRISLPRHDLLGEERWPISQRKRAKGLFLNGLLLGSVCAEIQVKLINHCQAVRVKQWITYKDFEGLF